MKKLLALVLITISFSSFASLITFRCKSIETAGVHKFDAIGIVSIDEYDKVEGVISLQVEKAQAPGSVQIFEELKIEGSRQHFPAGRLTKKAFDQLSLTSEDTYIKSLNLLLNLDAQNASQIFTVDNFLYRSNCEVASKR